MKWLRTCCLEQMQEAQIGHCILRSVREPVSEVPAGMQAQRATCNTGYLRVPTDLQLSPCSTLQHRFIGSHSQLELGTRVNVSSRPALCSTLSFCGQWSSSFLELLREVPPSNQSTRHKWWVCCPFHWQQLTSHFPRSILYSVHRVSQLSTRVWFEWGLQGAPCAG